MKAFSISFVCWNVALKSNLSKKTKQQVLALLGPNSLEANVWLRASVYTLYCTFMWAGKVRREEGRGPWKMWVHAYGCVFSLCVCVCVRVRERSPVIRSLWRRKALFNVLVFAASRHSHKHTSSPGAIPVILHPSSSPVCPCSPLPGKAFYVS